MSGVLLDTHALVWLSDGDPRLGPRSRSLTDDALSGQELLVSAISFWEVTLLANRSRVLLGQPVASWRLGLIDLGIVEVPLTGIICIFAAELDGFRRDPADRMITSRALEAGATLVTADERILAWPGTLPRHDART